MIDSLLAFVCSPYRDGTGAVFTYRIRPDRRAIERVDAVPSKAAKFPTLDREGVICTRRTTPTAAGSPRTPTTRRAR